MSAVSNNSAHIYILDACGYRYCEVMMRNVPETIESHKAHCRWYLGRSTGVCKPAKIVVVFYHDKSAAKVDRRMGR